MTSYEYPEFILFQKKDRLTDLERTCYYARTVEEIVLAWIERGNTVVVAHNPEMSWPAIGFTFVRGRRAVAMANIPVDKIVASYPNYERIGDKIVQFSDQEGFLPDHEWFDKRNQRLRIFNDEVLKMNRVPARALGELILSYALSEVGFAEISYGKKVAGEQFLKLSLIYFGPDVEQENSGWYENASMSLAELREFIPEALWV